MYISGWMIFLGVYGWMEYSNPSFVKKKRSFQPLASPCRPAIGPKWVRTRTSIQRLVAPQVPCLFASPPLSPPNTAASLPLTPLNNGSEAHCSRPAHPPTPQNAGDVGGEVYGSPSIPVTFAAVELPPWHPPLPGGEGPLCRSAGSSLCDRRIR